MLSTSIPLLCSKWLSRYVEALAKASQYTAVLESCIFGCMLSPRVPSTDWLRTTEGTAGQAGSIGMSHSDYNWLLAQQEYRKERQDGNGL
jgi:hypothetical protein